MSAAVLVTRKLLWSIVDVFPQLAIVTVREGDNVTRLTQPDTNASPPSSSSSPASVPPPLPDLDLTARVSSSYLCSSCAVAFDSADDLREHAKSAWHVHNIQQSSAHRPTVTEEQFAALPPPSSAAARTAASASSGAAHESDSGDDDDLKEVMPALSLHDERGEDGDDEVTLAGSPRIAFSSPSQRVLVWRSLLAHPKQSSSLLFPERSALYLRSLRALPSLQRTAVFLSLGGRFSAAVFRQSEAVQHRSFQRYTVRAKQGGSQTANDASNAGHKAQSIGSSIRRKEAVRYMEEVHRTLADWRAELRACQLIWLYAPGANRRMFYGEAVAKVEEGGGVKEVDVSWAKDDLRIRGVPFSVHRPTFAEVQRVHRQLTTIDFVDRHEGDEDESDERRTEPAVEERKDEADLVEAREEPPEDDFLLQAIERGDAEAVQRLHESEYQRPTPPAGRTGLVPPVYHAVVHGRVEFVAALCAPPLSFSADEQCIDSSSSGMSVCWSPLHWACAHAQTAAVLALLRAGADPTQKDSRGLTPYACAVGDEGKDVRLAMRKWASGEGEGRWQYEAAGFVPQKALTEEEEEEKRRREKEKDKARKQKQKERAKQRKDEERTAAARADAERQQREAQEAVRRVEVAKQAQAAQAIEEAWQAREKAIEGMSDRERRALAAERRLAASKTGGAGAARCDQCAAPLIRVPYERLHYKYCTLLCLQKHRDSLEKG